jgi:DNA-binding protein H-NS
MATTLTDLEQQLAELTARVDAARADLREHAVAQIKLIMAEYYVSAVDLVEGTVSVALKPAKTKANGATKPKATKATKATKQKAVKPSKATKPPKYLDPATGATWSGYGHTPGWLVDKNRDQFLIQ